MLSVKQTEERWTWQGDDSLVTLTLRRCGGGRQPWWSAEREGGRGQCLEERTT